MMKLFAYDFKKNDQLNGFIIQVGNRFTSIKSHTLVPPAS